MSIYFFIFFSSFWCLFPLFGGKKLELEPTIIKPRGGSSDRVKIDACWKTLCHPQTRLVDNY